MTGFLADHAGARVHASPNFGERRSGTTPDAIILHYTGMESAVAAESWLCDRQSEVSAHYLVHENGSVVQMVREADRAWHAGQSSWAGATDVNSLSIGIEIANPGHAFGYPGFHEPQIVAVTALCLDICRRHAIRPERVLAHSDVAPERKIDPGEKFPWDRLARAGVGHFVEPAEPADDIVLEPGDTGPDVETLQTMLAHYGYGIAITGLYDRKTQAVVSAFQRHFRPLHISGTADSGTIATLRGLLAALDTRPQA